MQVDPVLTAEVQEAFWIIINEGIRWLFFFFGFDMAEDPEATQWQFLLRFVFAAFPVVIIAVLSFSSVLRIIHKAGFSRLWIFPLMIPVVNLVLFLGFAVAEWPLERKLKRARRISKHRAQLALEEEITTGRFLIHDHEADKLPEDYREL